MVKRSKGITGDSVLEYCKNIILYIICKVDRSKQNDIFIVKFFNN